MKKILIVTHAMELGGAERALLGLLDQIDYSQYQIDLFLMRHEGQLLKYINKNVNLLEEDKKYASLAVPIGNVIKNGQLDVALGRIYGKYRAKLYVHKLNYPKANGVALEYSHKYTWRFMPYINPDVEYDLAVSFLTPHYFVAKRVHAKKKVAWIHTDYSVIKVDIGSEYKMWSSYDRIISISDDVTKAFLSVFPELKSKIFLIENIQPEKLIRRQVKEFNPNNEMSGNWVKLLSVGRFTYQKNFDNIPDICRKICEAGLDIKWYLIGFGPDEELLRNKIETSNMQNRVIILGKKENPYPYIEKCDVYVQPSRFEGKSVTVREAQLLGKPVIITAYATAESQLKNGIDGIIVPIDNDRCAAGIISVLKNVQVLETLRNNCLSNDYSNSKEVQKFYSLLN